MTYIQHYDSPLGGILLAADEIGLTGLWFEGQKYFARDLSDERVEQETPALAEARRWLDIYFTGKEPDFVPYRTIYHVPPTNKCSVGRDALIAPWRNVNHSLRTYRIFVGDDACIVPLTGCAGCLTPGRTKRCCKINKNPPHARPP